MKIVNENRHMDFEDVIFIEPNVFGDAESGLQKHFLKRSLVNLELILIYSRQSLFFFTKGHSERTTFSANS